MHDRKAQEGLLRKQKLNAHTCAVLAVLGFGSLTYGYTASIIGTTLGKMSWVPLIVKTNANPRSTVIHRILRACHPLQWDGSDIHHEWSVPDWRRHWNIAIAHRV